MMDIFGNSPSLGEIKSELDEYEHPSDEESKDVLEEEKEKSSFSIFYFLCLIISLIFLFRLVDLQITQGAKHQYLAEGNRIRARDIPAPRGIIYDRQGQVLVQNIASFNLELYPADLPQNKEDREAIYQRIEEVSQISMQEIKDKIEEIGLFSVDTIILKENIEREEALLLKIKYADYSGIMVAARPSRQYQTIPGLSHLLGYIGKITQEELDENSDYKITSWIGKSGVELTHEESLKGEVGKEQIEVDSRGRIQRVLANLEPQPGHNIYLGLDLELQKEMASSLGAMIEERDVNHGVAIALDPRDGTVLGMVSLPSYDNNLFIQRLDEEKYQQLLDDSDKPMVNRAITGVYPSGSTIKPMIAATALQEKTISQHTILDCPGEIEIGEWKFPDWKVHGRTDVRKAIAESCNVFFYAVGGGWQNIPGLGINRIKDYLEKFGFGQVTGIDLTGESAGLISDPEWKKKNKNESWYLGDTYHMAIGQGDFLTTPLQLVNAIATIANGGELLKPHLISKETDFAGQIVKEYGKEVIRKDFIDVYNLKVVREGMRQAVISGSARQLADLPVEVAGKTGTAQFDQTERTHAWFVSFAPYNNPEIALIVLVEAGGEGHEVAVPVAREILNWYFSH